MRKLQSDFQMNYTIEKEPSAQITSFCDYVELDDFACWVAVDINADADPKIARVIVGSILKDFKSNPTIIQQNIREYMINARELAFSLEDHNLKKVDLAIMATDYSIMLCVVSGDERLYHLQRVLQSKNSLSKAEVLELGVNDYNGIDQLADSVNRNTVFGAFIAQTIALRDGDVIFLCNQGFWENAGLDDIFETLQGINESFVFLYNLKSLMTHKSPNSSPGYTMVAIFVNRVYKNNLTDNLKNAGAVAVLSLFMMGLFVFKPFAGQAGLKGEAAQATSITQSTPANRMNSHHQNTYAVYEQNGDSLVKMEDYRKAFDEYNQAISCDDIKDRSVRNRIQKKLEITQLVSDADQLAAKGRFGTALAKYGVAKRLAASEAGLCEQSGLEKRAATVQVKLTVNDMVAAGDREVANNNFNEALEQYKSAQTLAKNVLYNTAGLGLGRKILKVKAKITDERNDLQREQLQAQKEQENVEMQRQLEKMQAEYENKESEQPRQTEKTTTENGGDLQSQ